jgi:hypothetical protein
MAGFASGFASAFGGGGLLVPRPEAGTAFTHLAFEKTAFYVDGSNAGGGGSRERIVDVYYDDDEAHGIVPEPADPVGLPRTARIKAKPGAPRTLEPTPMWQPPTAPPSISDALTWIKHAAEAARARQYSEHEAALRAEIDDEERWFASILEKL